MHVPEDSRKGVGTLLALCLLFLFQGAADAQERGSNQEKYFDIPQQRADLSLIEFAEQADITLIFSFDLARDKTANRLVGSYTANEAIELLLKGTGLAPTFGIDGYINIEPAEEPVAEGVEMLDSKKTGVLAVMASLFASPFAEAQSGSEGAMEEVVVVGIRQAIDNAIAEKRNAANVVESLALGDLGELPSISIGDSIEFLPGVSGTRFRGNVDQISLRGLPGLFTFSTVNGRELSSGNGSRFVRYRIYPSDFFTSVKLSKSPLPDQVEGGISGTIDLRTPSALGSTGPKLVLDARLQSSPFNDNHDLIDDIGSRATGRFTTSTDLGNGEFGMVLGLDYMDNPLVVAQSNLGGASRRTLFGEQVLTPNNALFSNATEGFKRKGGLVVLEWASDGGTVLKFDAIITRTENPQYRNFLQINNLNATDRYVDAVIDGGALQSGSLTNVQVLNRFNDFQRSDDADMFGLNLQTEFGDWRAEFDVYSTETDMGYRIDNPIFSTQADMDFDFTGGELRFSNISTDLTDLANWGMNAYNGDWRRTNDKTRGLRVDFDRDLSGFFTAVKFGARYSERSIFDLVRRDNDSSVRNGALYPEFQPGALDPSLVASPYFEFDLRGDSRGTFPAPFVPFDMNAVLAVVPPKDFAESTNADLLNRLVDNDEESLAAYVRADFASEIGGTPVTGAFGVRVVQTDLTANGYTGTPVAVTDPVTGAVTIEVPGDLALASEKNSYTEVLPSLNMKLEFSDEWVGRFGIARTMSRPNFKELRLSQDLRGGDPADQPFTGRAGNPTLDPIIADQVDVSLEWYPRDGTALSAALYYKDVDGFVVTDVRSATIGGYEYELSSPVNLDSAKFSGIELAVRHDFDHLPAPFDGLGVMVNATFNDTDADPGYGILNETDATTGDYLYDVADRDPGVVGFAKRTASGLLYYQSDRWSIRASAKYLSDRVRQNSFLNAPRISEAQTRYDFATSFHVTDTLSLHFQALNITEVPDEAFWVFDHYTSFYQQTGRAYFLGASFRM